MYQPVVSVYIPYYARKAEGTTLQTLYNGLGRIERMGTLK